MNGYEKCVLEALSWLIQTDRELIETQPKEECINHKLAQYLEAVLRQEDLLSCCAVDIEYDKHREDEKKTSEGRKIRPDIIAHECRSGNRNNLIVIEAKKRYDVKKDRDNVAYLVNSMDYQYKVGAVISYLPRKDYVKIKFLKRGGGWEKYRLSKADLTITESKR